MVILDRDEGLRPNTTMEGLAKLSPVKGIVSYKPGPILITAGNSCPRNAGVTVQLIMSEEMALKLGIEYLARVIGWGNGGCQTADHGHRSRRVHPEGSQACRT